MKFFSVIIFSVMMGSSSWVWAIGSSTGSVNGGLDSPWSAHMNLSLEKSLDDRPDNSKMSMELKRRLGPMVAVQAGWAIYQQLQRAEADPDGWSNTQFDDFNLDLSHSNLFASSKGQWFGIGSVGLVAPASKTSQQAGMRFSNTMSLEMRKVFSKAVLSFDNKIIYYNHEYETANKSGTVYNIEIGSLNGFRGTVYLSEALLLNGATHLFTYHNYNGVTKRLQMYSAGLAYVISNSTSLWFHFFSKERILTHNSLFDDSNTKFNIGVKHAF